MGAKVPSPFPRSTDTVPDPLFASARSGFPSRFRSPIARDCGAPSVPKSLLVPKVPSPFPINTDRVLELIFTTARSGFPSAFRAPIATE